MDLDGGVVEVVIEIGSRRIRNRQDVVPLVKGSTKAKHVQRIDRRVRVLRHSSTDSLSVRLDREPRRRTGKRFCSGDFRPSAEAIEDRRARRPNVRPKRSSNPESAYVRDDSRGDRQLNAHRTDISESSGLVRAYANQIAHLEAKLRPLRRSGIRLRGCPDRASRTETNICAGIVRTGTETPAYSVDDIRP